jgi:hypothetical protein
LSCACSAKKQIGDAGLAATMPATENVSLVEELLSFYWGKYEVIFFDHARRNAWLFRFIQWRKYSPVLSGNYVFKFFLPI